MVAPNLELRRRRCNEEQAFVEMSGKNKAPQFLSLLAFVATVWNSHLAAVNGLQVDPVWNNHFRPSTVAIQSLPPSLWGSSDSDLGTGSLIRRHYRRIVVVTSFASTSVDDSSSPSNDANRRCSDIAFEHNDTITSAKRSSHPKEATRYRYDGRRSFLVAAASSCASAIVFGRQGAAWAAATPRAKGAAEYDMEYYLRDLLKGNSKQGNLPASAPPKSLPPRRLGGPYLPLLLDNSCSSACIVGRELAKLGNGGSGAVSDLVDTYRSKAIQAGYFGGGNASGRQPRSNDVTDEYYFDVTSYAAWRAAAELMPTDYARRDRFVRDLGRGLYREAKKGGLLVAARGSIPDSSDDSVDDSSDDDAVAGVGGTISNDSSDDSSDDSVLNGSLTGTLVAVKEILDLYNKTRYCASYRMGGDERGGQTTGVGAVYDIFDELDDEDFDSGNPVNCLVSVYRPATLQAALQITGEGSRFSPDFVGPTLAAMWEELLPGRGVKVSYESYFVDQEYRPNPKDFFPDEQLLQFTLVKKA